MAAPSNGPAETQAERLPLLHRRYPTAYGPDDATRWATIDKDFLTLFYGTGSDAMTDRQLRLFVALASDPSWPDLVAGKRVWWSVATLAARTGLRCDHIVPALTTAPLGVNVEKVEEDLRSPSILRVDPGIETKGRIVFLYLGKSDSSRFVQRVTTMTAGKGRQSAPVTSELLAFLFSRLGRVQVRLVLRLLCAIDFDGGTVATLADETLVSDNIIHQQRSLRREIDDPAFRALVRVDRGTPDSPGRKGITTTYDLAPLLREFGTWRQSKTSRAVALAA